VQNGTEQDPRLSSAAEGPPAGPAELGDERLRFQAGENVSGPAFPPGRGFPRAALLKIGDTLGRKARDLVTRHHEEVQVLDAVGQTQHGHAAVLGFEDLAAVQVHLSKRSGQDETGIQPLAGEPPLDLREITGFVIEMRLAIPRLVDELGAQLRELNRSMRDESSRCRRQQQQARGDGSWNPPFPAKAQRPGAMASEDRAAQIRRRGDALQAAGQAGIKPALFLQPTRELRIAFGLPKRLRKAGVGVISPVRAQHFEETTGFLTVHGTAAFEGSSVITLAGRSSISLRNMDRPREM